MAATVTHNILINFKACCEETRFINLTNERWSVQLQFNDDTMITPNKVAFSLHASYYRECNHV